MNPPQSSGGASPFSPPGAPFSEAAAWQCATLKECQELLAPRLDKPLLRAFWRLTGLRLHVLWHDPIEVLRPGGAAPALCPSARQQHHAGRDLPARCPDCLALRWSPAGRNARPGRVFTGPCGAASCWAQLHAGPSRPLTLALQAPPHGGMASSPAASPVLRPREPASVRFHDAAAWLGVILHDLQSALQAGLAQRDLAAAQTRIAALETEDDRLRRELRRRAPDIPESPPPQGVRTHSQQIVQRMLDYVHAHYQRPLQLADVAGALNMNACYLSSLFSRALGVTFHVYLDELRLARAKQLLRDPACLACDVSSAVGYASAESFRHAFKAKTGMAPSAWRDTHAGVRPPLGPGGPRLSP